MSPEKRNVHRYSRWDRRRDEIMERSNNTRSLYDFGKLISEIDDVVNLLRDIKEFQTVEKFLWAKAVLVKDVLERRKKGEKGVNVYHAKISDEQGIQKTRLMLVFLAENENGGKINVFAPYKELSLLIGNTHKVANLAQPYDTGWQVHLPEGLRPFRSGRQK